MARSQDDKTRSLDLNFNSNSSCFNKATNSSADIEIISSMFAMN